MCLGLAKGFIKPNERIIELTQNEHKSNHTGKTEAEEALAEKFAIMSESCRRAGTSVNELEKAMKRFSCVYIGILYDADNPLVIYKVRIIANDYWQALRKMQYCFNKRKWHIVKVVHTADFEPKEFDFNEMIIPIDKLKEIL